MSIDYIRLVESSCHNCMRCVRACPTSAMTYVNHQPVIKKDECILCGRCFSVCPHEAKSVISDFATVKKWIENGEQVVMSVAPSFVSVWPHFESLAEILRNRGFSVIEETARGAKVVSQAYANLIEDGEMENIITTCCPAVNALIEKEYGDLIPNMAPVVSPLITHGRMLKETYPDAKVVFLSPCIAKYKEIKDPRFAGAVDACISMEELAMWISASLQENEDALWKDFEGSVARLYPTPGGIISTLDRNPKYKYINVEGPVRIREVLQAIRDGQLKGYFIEMNSCEGSCMGGPLLSHFKHNEWLGQGIIRENVRMDKPIVAGPLPVDINAEWKKEDIYRPHHTEEEIKEAMIAMGKTNPSKIHDCGACGYETCRLKAIAVLEGKADPRICLPEAVSQAEDISNSIIKNSPNGIIVLDEDCNVYETNPAARHMLNLDMVNPTGMALCQILPEPALERLVRMTGNTPEYMRVRYECFDKLIDHAIVKIPEQKLTVLILMDYTKEDAKERKIMDMRIRTLEVTQQVIDEQMRAVQEIASLLGESTARSKVSLTKLKQAMDEGVGDE